MSNYFYHPLGNYAENYVSSASLGALPHTYASHGFGNVAFGTDGEQNVYSMTNGAVAGCGEMEEDGKKFFISLAETDIDHIAIENPIGIMNTQWRKPDQIVQPYFFGDEASKTTCLWLKNLPDLKPTKIVGKGEWIELSSGKRLPKWYSDALTKAKTPEERSNLRSKTFPGFAKAIAEQWGEFLINESIKERKKEK